MEGNDLVEEDIRKIAAEACYTASIPDDYDLIESRLLNSLAFINILPGLEDIGIEILPAQTDRSYFRTIESIVFLIERLKKLVICSLRYIDPKTENNNTDTIFRRYKYVQT